MSRPSRTPFRAAVVAASALTVAALAVVVYPNPQAPAYPTLSEVASAPVVTPGERAGTDTNRGGERVTLAPLPPAGNP